MQDKKDDLAIVPDTNVLASEFWEMFKDREDVYLPRAVLEEIEFNYLIWKMLVAKSNSIALIRDSRIVSIRLEQVEEKEKEVMAIIKTRVYPWRETEVDRILDELGQEESKNGRSDRYYRIKNRLPKRHYETRPTKTPTPTEDQEPTEELPEKESKVMKKAFLKANVVYLQIIDLINSGKWTLTGSKGSGVLQLLEKIFQDYHLGLTGKRENGIGRNDIRILSTALNLALESGKKVILLTTDNHLAKTWQSFETDVKSKIGKRFHMRVVKLRFKNRN